jgi:hypothetical protein
VDLGARDALVEALAGRLAQHQRAARHDVAEMIRAALRASGFQGAYLDASHIVGVLPPTVGGLPPTGALELVDADAETLVDDRGLALVADASFASATHSHAGTVGAHEEFLPAAAATTVTLGTTPEAVLVVARNGVVQSIAAGHYSVSGATVTFTTGFDGTERVVVAYEV